MSALLIAEHNNKELKPFTLNAITAASQIDEDLHVLLIGHNADEVAKSISQKLVRRHPYVFSDQKDHTAKDQVTKWEEIKIKER